MGDLLRSQFGRTFTELLAHREETTSGRSSQPSGKSAKETIAFLDCRKTARDDSAGPTRDLSWETIVLSPGEGWTPNIGESPRDASVSSLSSILEDNVPERYYLSVRACEGIIRRAAAKGKPLPPLLDQALRATMSLGRSSTIPRTDEPVSDETESSRPSPDEWGQGGTMSR